VRIFKNKAFARFSRKGRVSDADLREAITRIASGLVDADLGGGVFKQRIARAGGGKSGGFRAIVVLRAGGRAFFVHGFAKSERDNIRDDELEALKRLARELLAYDDAAIAQALAAGVLTEITSHDEASS
jgi:hypothetical protein